MLWKWRGWPIQNSDWAPGSQTWAPLFFPARSLPSESYCLISQGVSIAGGTGMAPRPYFADSKAHSVLLALENSGSPSLSLSLLHMHTYVHRHTPCISGFSRQIRRLGHPGCQFLPGARQLLLNSSCFLQAGKGSPLLHSYPTPPPPFWVMSHLAPLFVPCLALPLCIMASSLPLYVH